jgi:hypothetical protein
MAEVRKSGLASVGRPSEAGTLVRYDASLDHDGDVIITFVGVLHSLDGTDLARFYGSETLLTFADGPTVEIVIVNIDDDEAIFQLAAPHG